MQWQLRLAVVHTYNALVPALVATRQVALGCRWGPYPPDELGQAPDTRGLPFPFREPILGRTRGYAAEIGGDSSSCPLRLCRL